MEIKHGLQLYKCLYYKYAFEELWTLLFHLKNDTKKEVVHEKLVCITRGQNTHDTEEEVYLVCYLIDNIIMRTSDEDIYCHFIL